MSPQAADAGFGGWLLRGGLGLFGLVFGSFLNVLIHRLPREESPVVPASCCPFCHAPIRPRDNLPVVSFLLLRGRCRHCRTRIPLRYPLVEGLTAALFLATPLTSGWALAATWMAFPSLLLVLALTDWERMVLPNALTLPGAVCGLLLSVPRPDLDAVSSLLGALLGAGLLLFLRFLWLRFRKVEALGQGDIKMMLAVGAFLGPAATLHTLVLASALGLAVASLLLLRRRIERTTPLPFGTFLALGAALVFFFAFLRPSSGQLG